MPEVYMTWNRFRSLMNDVTGEAEDIAEDMFRADQSITGIPKEVGDAIFLSQVIQGNGIPVKCQYNNAIGVNMEKIYFVPCHKIRFKHFKGF